MKTPPAYIAGSQQRFPSTSEKKSEQVLRQMSRRVYCIKTPCGLKEIDYTFYFETPLYLKIENHDQYSNIDHTPLLPGLTITNIYHYYVIFHVIIFPFFTMSRSNLAEAPRLVKQSAIIALPDTASILFNSPSSKLSFKTATSILNL